MLSPAEAEGIHLKPVARVSTRPLCIYWMDIFLKRHSRTDGSRQTLSFLILGRHASNCSHMRHWNYDAPRDAIFTWTHYSLPFQGVPHYFDRNFVPISGLRMNGIRCGLNWVITWAFSHRMTVIWFPIGYTGFFGMDLTVVSFVHNHIAEVSNSENRLTRSPQNVSHLPIEFCSRNACDVIRIATFQEASELAVSQ